MDKTYYVKRYDMAVWYERLALYFLPYRTHESTEGFVIYKLLLNRMYIYVHGHYVKQESPIDPGFDGGHSRPWSN